VEVVVAMRGRRMPALAARAGRTARALLAALRLPDAELSVLLCSDAVIHALNRDWRGKDRATDVLSFAQREGEGGAPAGLLGDVVISLDTAARQARERGETLGRECDRLLIHGLLHLLGYDHERSRAEARRMQARERALGRALAARRSRRGDAAAAAARPSAGRRSEGRR
jgi:probable rRNA maturation factor